jgi:hypothetical protein
MVQVTQAGGSTNLWNVSSRVGPGSTGDDVKLVQYLLARAPEAANYGGPISGQSGIAVANVDGIWGPQTAAAMSWFEKSWKGRGNLQADSVVDPNPPGSCNFGVNGNFLYKITALQVLYGVAQLKDMGMTADGGTVANTVLAMPTDGQCPQDLAYVLQNAAVSIAQNINYNDPNPGADGGSGGADGGGSGGSDGN